MFKAIKQKKAGPLYELIANKGFPVNSAITTYGLTPLLYCSAMGNGECLNTIIKLNPDPEQTDNLGRNAFHYACKAGNLENFKILYENFGEDEKIDLNAQSESGVTPLMDAIQSVEAELVVECLNHQANPFCIDGFGKRALDYASHLTDVNGVDF